MGTPVACNYTTVTYGHYENTEILNSFKSNLLYYRRYIDDMLGIWLPPPTNQIVTWNRFKEALNKWGSLEWIVKEPSKQTNSLTCTCQLHNGRITTSTYQKDLNLYLYTPPPPYQRTLPAVSKD
jgi:hypothetical protein